MEVLLGTMAGADCVLFRTMLLLHNLCLVAFGLNKSAHRSIHEVITISSLYILRDYKLCLKQNPDRYD